LISGCPPYCRAFDASRVPVGFLPRLILCWRSVSIRAPLPLSFLLLCCFFCLPHWLDCVHPPPKPFFALRPTLCQDGPLSYMQLIFPTFFYVCQYSPAVYPPELFLSLSGPMPVIRGRSVQTSSGFFLPKETNFDFLFFPPIICGIPLTFSVGSF